MSKWVLSRPGVWAYLPLGFYATDDDILDATARPDSYWSLNPDQDADETVTRFTAGTLDPYDGGFPCDYATPRERFDGGTPTSQASLPLDGGTP